MEESRDADPQQLLGQRIILRLLAAEFCLIVGNLLVRVCSREDLVPIGVGWCVALAASIPMVVFAFYFIQRLRSDLDEMLQRVVMEGLAFAMVVFIPLAGLYVNARAAGLLSSNIDPPELLLIPSILVVVGVLISWSRLK